MNRGGGCGGGGGGEEEEEDAGVVYLDITVGDDAALFFLAAVVLEVVEDDAVDQEGWNMDMAVEEDTPARRPVVGRLRRTCCVIMMVAHSII